MNNTETLATSDTQDTVQHRRKRKPKDQRNFVLYLVYPMLPVSLCCSFLIVPSVYSSVYCVPCLVYPMLPVSLCCSFLIVPRRDNQELTTQRHWQHRIRKTHDKINTRVNRRDNQEWITMFTLVFILSCVLCIRFCQCLCVVHSWLSLLVTLVFILSCVLCIRCYQCLCVNNTETLTTSDTQDTGQNKH
jgi:magnesium-transporting ATPase (P-type)